MRKNRTQTILLALILLAISLICASASAAAGGVDDPVISLSYLKNVFGPEIKAQLSSEAERIAKDTFAAEKDALVAEVKGAASGGSKEYETVQIKKGQILSPAEGSSIEVLLRRGSYICVDSVGEKIPNLTTGTEIASGEPMPLQNLYIVPKNDGRGIQAVADADGWLMVRGAYQLTEA